MCDENRQRDIRNAWPQLVDFLSHHPEWVRRKAEQLLPEAEVDWGADAADQKEKVSRVLDLFLRAADADGSLFKVFIESVCMECNLPLELEIVFMSVSGDGQEDFGEAATQLQPPPARLERRRPWSNASTSNNCKQSKQQRFDSAERYRQLIITSVRQRFGVDRLADAAEVRGGPSAFSQAFVNLVIYQSRAKGKTDKAKEDPRALHDPEEHGSTTVRSSDLFERVHTRTTRLIFLLGKPGMGKTRLVHRICQEWAEGVLPQFQFVFFFEFRQLNLIKRKLTLRELLFDFFLQPENHPDAVFEHLLENAQNMLLIFDGLDEFVENIQHPALGRAPVPDLPELASISELFAGLCQGKVLPGCTVLVTTRPKILPEAFFKPDTLLAEIWGFDREKVEEYAGNFFHQHAQKEQALACLTSNARLLSMCHIPALCNIICICLEYLLLQNAGSVQLPQTVTQLYLKMLHTFLCKHQGLGASGEVDVSQHHATLAGLCELGFKGLEEKKMLFYAAEVPGHVKDFACRNGLLLAFEVKASNGQARTGYTFAHFSLQEFFAALFLLTSPTVDNRSLKQRFFLRSKWTLKKGAKTPFTENCHIFLSGLASQGCLRFLSALAQQGEAWIQARQALFVQMLKRLATAQLTGPKIAELCHCVYETQSLDVAQHVAKQLNFKYHFRNFRLMPLDMMTLAFVIKSHPDLVSLHFAGCPMELDYLEVLGSCENIKSLSFRSRKYGNEFVAALSPSLPKIKSLATFHLVGGNISAPGLEELLRALPSCRQLEDLSLQDNKLKEQEMIKITEIFSTVKKLKKMDLSYNEISPRVILAFTRAAAVCPDVAKLHIRRNTLTVYFTSCSEKDPRLEDVGSKEEEFVPNARTLVLRLQDCRLDFPQTEKMADILLRGPHLSEIDLSDNHIGDEGCKELMKMVPQMRISGPLILNNNQLSVKSIFCFLDSMRTCPSITRLEASVHRQTATLTLVGGDVLDAPHPRRDSAHEDPLKRDRNHVAAASRTICLADNHFHGELLKRLCFALRGCGGITELDLSNNNLSDVEALMVAGLLPFLGELRSLTLDGNRITLNGVLDLVQFFFALEHAESAQFSLGGAQKVHITFGERIRYGLTAELQGEVPRQALCGRRFCLRDCLVSPEAASRLFGMLTRYPGLAEISLSGNSLNDQAVAHLMTLLPSLQSLKSLRISENRFSPGSVCLLANSLNLCERLCEVEVRSSENAVLHFVENQGSQARYCRLIECGLGQDAVQDLCAIVEKCDRLAELDLSGNNLGNEGLRCLLEHLPQSQVSCLLRISQNRISQEGVLHLVNALAVYKHVAEVLVSLSSEEMLLKTLVGEDKPQKTLRLKHCSFQPEHLMQLLSVLGKCATLHHFMSTDNAIMVNDAEDLFRTLWKPEGLLRTGIEEPWVKDESIVTFLKMAAGVQGNVTALTRDGGLFMVEQEFPHWEEKMESVVSRLHQCELEARGVCFLPKLMEKCCQLWALNWSQVRLTDAEAALTFDALFHFPALRRLRIACCRIPSAGMKCLAAALHHCHAMEDLDLSKSELSADGVGPLLAALEGKRHLQSVNLSSLSLDNANILRLISTLAMMPLLRRLVLSNNHLGSEACLRLADVLKKAIHMKEVDLSFGKIHSAGLKELVAALSEMRSVTHVDLSGNNLGDETLGKLATILPSLQHLKVLRLSSCEIDAEGAAHLARAVVQCQQIEELSLSENAVGDKGVAALAERPPQVSQLRRIELKVCGITDRASKTLATWLSHCPLLEEAVLSWNQLGDDSASELARLLPRLPKLRILDLDRNCITAHGAGGLAKALASCRGIQFIRLWCNRIPKEVEQQLGGQEPRLHFA